MVSSSNKLPITANQLRYYQEQGRAEAWKKDHDEAMQRADFEEYVAFGIAVFDLINRQDEAWRSKVSRRQVAFGRAAEEGFLALYAAWLTPYEMVMGHIERFERLGYEVSGAEDFQSRCGEAANLLGLPHDGDPLPSLPPYETLRAWVDRHPPPPEWLEGEESKPFLDAERRADRMRLE